MLKVLGVYMCVKKTFEDVRKDWVLTAHGSSKKGLLISPVVVLKSKLLLEESQA